MNLKPPRQMSYKSKSNLRVFTTNVQTPLSLGLALYNHSLFRSKVQLETLSNINICSSYKQIMQLRCVLAAAILDRVKDTGGFH